MMVNKCSQCKRSVKGHEGPTGKKCVMEPLMDGSEDRFSQLEKQLSDLATAVKTLTTQKEEEGGVTKPDFKTQQDLLQHAGEKLDNIFGDLDSPYPVDEPEVSVARCYDPRNTLTIRARKKPLHITDFLSESTKQRLKSKKQNLVFHNITDGTMQVKSDDSHPYQGISLAEWGAANVRLLNQLLASGNLRHDQVEYYLAYTATVFDFHGKYQWSSILDYDHNYREQQAEHGFMWGQVSPMLELNILKPLEHQSVQRQSAKPRLSHAASGQQQKCRQWLLTGGNCSFGDACRYEHVPLGVPKQTTVPPPNFQPMWNGGQQNYPGLGRGRGLPLNHQ